MYSFDAFSDLPPGTRFLLESPSDLAPTIYIKLAPHGGDVGHCNLVNLNTGEIVHAYDIWPMREYKEDLDLGDIASFDPKFDKVVEVFSWEKDLLNYFAYTSQVEPTSEDWDMVDHVNQVFSECDDPEGYSPTFIVFGGNNPPIYGTLEEILENLGIDLPSSYSQDEEEQRLFDEFQRRMEDPPETD